MRTRQREDARTHRLLLTRNEMDRGRLKGAVYVTFSLYRMHYLSAMRENVPFFRQGARARPYGRATAAAAAAAPLPSPIWCSFPPTGEGGYLAPVGISRFRFLSLGFATLLHPRQRPATPGGPQSQGWAMRRSSSMKFGNLIPTAAAHERPSGMMLVHVPQGRLVGLLCPFSRANAVMIGPSQFD